MFIGYLGMLAVSRIKRIILQSLGASLWLSRNLFFSVCSYCRLLGCCGFGNVVGSVFLGLRGVISVGFLLLRLVFVLFYGMDLCKV